MSLENTDIVVNKANEAIRNLRTTRLAKGLPFMISSKDLEDDKCFLEYPDGHISLARPNASGTQFTIIRTLTKSEAQSIRSKFNLA